MGQLRYGRPFEVRDFDGGETDFPNTGRPDQAQKYENWQPDKDRRVRTRDGSKVYVSTDRGFATTYPLFGDGSRIGDLHYFKRQFMLAQYGKKMMSSDQEGTGQPTAIAHTGTSSTDILEAGDDESLASSIEIDKRFYITNDAGTRIATIAESSGTFTTRTLGLPVFPTGTDGQAVCTCTPTGSPTGLNAYLYYFVFAYSFTSDGKTYKVYGATAVKEMEADLIDDPNPVSITGIPEIGGAGGNDPDELNYHKANINIEIYRTLINAGETGLAYLVKTVPNGTTSETDKVEDDDAQFNQTIYRSGGGINYTEVPEAKYLASAKGHLYAANLEFGGEAFPNRICHSIQGQHDNLMTTFFTDLEGPVTGIGNAKGFMLGFTEFTATRLEGNFFDDGTGGMSKKELSRDIGCISHNSIVSTPKGIYWAGADGFYWTDGVRAPIRISSDRRSTFKNFTFYQKQVDRIKGVYDETKQFIYWTLATQQTTEAATETDTIWLFDESKFNPFQGGEGAFYTWNNGQHFEPTAITYDGRNLIRGDSRGFVFIHDEDYRTDPIIHTDDNLLYNADSEIGEVSIPYDYTSMILELGLTYLRKWVSTVKLFLENITNLDAGIYSGNDGDQEHKEMEPVKFEDSWVWGDPTLVWGTSTYIWNFRGNIYASRRFPRGHRRCDSKQIKITSKTVTIYTGACTVSGNSATISAGNWTPDLLYYYIELSTDGGLSWGTSRLVNGYTSASVITFDGSAYPAGSYTYRIRGAKKDQRAKLIAYSIKYAFTSNQGSFKEEEA